MDTTEVGPGLETPSHLYTIHDSIPYATATRIRDSEHLEADAITDGATAHYQYTQTADEAVLAARPESWATAMRLGSMTMQAVKLDTAPNDTFPDLNSETDVDVASYSLLVFGRPATQPNHSIQEYFEDDGR